MIRVRVMATQGSAPREAGAEMFVSAEGMTGTIGGGQLEYMALDRARQMLRNGEALARMDIPLGPQIGQCCGGRVQLVLDRSGPAMRPAVPDALIFGAGHVGRALAVALRPLPVRPVLIDQRPEELGQAGPEIMQRLTPLPEAEIRAAPAGSAVIILTHDHALDFLLAVEALRRPELSYVGMIGSATKRAQFARFARRNQVEDQHLVCPIGAGFSQDKRPEIIAAFTAAELMAELTKQPQRQSCDI